MKLSTIVFGFALFVGMKRMDILPHTVLTPVSFHVIDHPKCEQMESTDLNPRGKCEQMAFHAVFLIS